MNKLSVVIITFNEEKNIARCISSVKDIADEILVVDSFSNDNTKALSISLGARFIEHVFDGHIQQKNWAASQSLYPHVLSLDADEALTEELKESISKIKNNWTADGYTFNRLNYYCGKWIKHGSWYPDKKLRLWDKNKGEWGGTNPHDKFEMKKNTIVKHIKGDLLHYTYFNITDHTLQVEKFTNIAAKELFNKNIKTSFMKLIFSGPVRFIRDYFLKLGFLDGYAGFRIAKISSYSTFLKYAKLKELNDKKQ